jgi:hypothetical protein
MKTKTKTKTILTKFGGLTHTEDCQVATLLPDLHIQRPLFCHHAGSQVPLPPEVYTAGLLRGQAFNPLTETTTLYPHSATVLSWDQRHSIP